MIHRLLLAACFCLSLLPFNAFCEADVVDDSENFALLEGQQATYESPVAHDDSNSYGDTRRSKESAFAKDEQALAKDDRQSSQSNSNTALLEKVQGLQQEVQELRGQLEVQSHDLKLLQEQDLSLYKDLDARLRGMPANDVSNKPATELSMDTTPTRLPPTLKNHLSNSSIAPATPVALPVVTDNRVNPANQQISYLAAYDFVKHKQYDDAILAMQTFVTKYPQSGYTANAQYWLGELYMVKKNYPQAIEHFNVVLQTYPSSSKSADSLLKMGYALAASGKTAEARVTLQEVIQKYPDTSTAKLAADKLNTLKNQ